MNWGSYLVHHEKVTGQSIDLMLIINHLNFISENVSVLLPRMPSLSQWQISAQP